MSVNSLETLQILNRDQGIILLSLPTSLLADLSQQVGFLKNSDPSIAHSAPPVGMLRRLEAHMAMRSWETCELFTAVTDQESVISTTYHQMMA